MADTAAQIATDAKAFAARCIACSPTDRWENDYSEDSAIPFAKAPQFNSKMRSGSDDLLTDRQTAYVIPCVTTEECALLWTALGLQRHRVKPAMPAGYRVYAVGDVHGRADLLRSLFYRIDADINAYPNTQSLHIFLGDYIDRGPNSRHVLDLLIARRRRHRAVYLKGNHESYVLRFLHDPSVLTEWQQMGGLATLLSYGVKPPSARAEEEIAIAFGRALPEPHLRFIEDLAPSFTIGDFFFAHAGVRPGVPLEQQSQQDLLWIRDDFLLHEGDFGKIVVHGHTPLKEPDIRPNRINIDTGAYATGRLTCLVLQGDEMRFL